MPLPPQGSVHSKGWTVLCLLGEHLPLPTCFTALAGNWTSQMPGWSRTCGFHKGLEIGEPSRPFPESSSHETPCSWTVLLKNSNSPLGLRIGRSQLLAAATTVTRIVSRRKRTTSPNMKSPTRFTPGPGRTATHLTSLPGCRQDTRGVRTYVSPFLFASSRPETREELPTPRMGQSPLDGDPTDRRGARQVCPVTRHRSAGVVAPQQRDARDCDLHKLKSQYDCFTN